MGSALLAGLLNVSDAQAIDTNPFSFKKTVNARRRKIADEEFSDGPRGLKYYDVEVGTGDEAQAGERIAIHYDVKFSGVTFMTSRMGMGVTGGTPFGFDVGQPAGSAGGTMTGIDLGVRGMRVGGIRKLKVPPGLAYGNSQVGEIPPGATLDVDIELLSIKTNPLGFRTKLIEG